MTWEELKEKAINNGYRYDPHNWEEEVIREPIEQKMLECFYKNGCVFIDGTLIAEKRTPDQMYQIMLALL